MDGSALWVDPRLKWVLEKLTEGGCAWKRYETGNTTWRRCDEKWRSLFDHPQEWLDCRAAKQSPKFPDFVHKVGEDSLWIEGKGTPAWDAQELGAAQAVAAS